jgi:hypothetical protein
MRNDEIVEKVRQDRDAFAAEFDYDLEAMARYLRAKEEQGDHKAVSLPARKPAQSERRKAV